MPVQPASFFRPVHRLFSYETSQRHDVDEGRKIIIYANEPASPAGLLLFQDGDSLWVQILLPLGQFETGEFIFQSADPSIES